MNLLKKWLITVFWIELIVGNLLEHFDYSLIDYFIY